MTQVINTQDEVGKDKSVAVPHVLRASWYVVKAANDIAMDDPDLGYLEFEIVKPRDNLTCIQIKHINADGEAGDVFLLSKIDLVESSGNRRWTQRGFRLQQKDQNYYVLISADPKLLLAYLSF